MPAASVTKPLVADPMMKVIVLPAMAAAVVVSVNVAFTVTQSEYCPVTTPLYTKLTGRNRTVKLVVHLFVLPAASTTHNVTLVVPRPTIVPATGRWLMARLPAVVQLSEATTALVNTGTGD